MTAPTPPPPEFPWSAVISGLVGIAGIAGSVLTAYFTNKAAERRMQLQQDFEDSRRFHKERAELYGRVLGLIQTFRVKALQLRHMVEHNQNTGGAWQEMTAEMAELSGRAKTAQLLGSSSTQDAAQTVLVAAGKLGGGMNVDKDEFKKRDDAMRAAETSFRDAARAELVAPDRTKAVSPPAPPSESQTAT